MGSYIGDCSVSYPPSSFVLPVCFRAAFVRFRIIFLSKGDFDKKRGNVSENSTMKTFPHAFSLMSCQCPSSSGRVFAYHVQSAYHESKMTVPLPFVIIGKFHGRQEMDV